MHFFSVLGLAIGLVFHATQISTAETTIKVSLVLEIPSPPDCRYPCAQEQTLPSFAKELNILGPEGSISTPLSRKAFRERLEDWRRHAEVYRRSAESERESAEDFHKGQVRLLVRMAYYDQLLRGYRNAFAMARQGNITYNTGG